MNKPTLEQIVDVMISKGMKVFRNPFSMNHGGIRTKDNAAETYNDFLFMYYWNDKGQLCGIVEPGTTDAGLFYRKNPINVKGTAIIKHSEQYIGAMDYQNPPVDFKLGHNGKEAFRQVQPMKYWRDADRDNYLEFDGEVFEEIAYTNGHDMGTGVSVGKNSAGCYGSAPATMDKFYALAKLQIKHKQGSRLTLTMLHETDFE